MREPWLVQLRLLTRLRAKRHPPLPTAAGSRGRARRVERPSPRPPVRIVRTVPHESPGEALAHQDSAQILSSNSADGDNPAIAVAVLLLADDRAACRQCLQPGRRHSTSGPTIRAGLGGLGRVDAPQAINNAALLERVAIGDGLSSARRSNWPGLPRAKEACPSHCSPSASAWP